MKNKLYIVITVTLMTGCATSSKMPERYYGEIGFFSGNLQKCFENDYISPQLFADAKNAVLNSINNWDYDQRVLKWMTDDYYMLAHPDQRACRKIEADAYQLISRENQNRVNQRQNQADLNDTLREINRNKPIFCNTIGTMTLCN